MPANVMVSNANYLHHGINGLISTFGIITILFSQTKHLNRSLRQAQSSGQGGA
jgi:hypothetical protein